MNHPLLYHIDDNPIVLEIVLEVLGKDYRVISCNKPEIIHDSISEISPDLILLDIMMPGIDGYDLCRGFRREPKTQPVPIVFLSTKNEFIDKITCFDVGGDAFLPLPPDKKELCLIVDALVERYRHRIYVEKKNKESTKVEDYLVVNRPDSSEFMEFARQMVMSKSINQVIQNTTSLLNSIGFNSTLMFRTLHGETVSRSDQIVATPLEFEIIRQHGPAGSYLFSGKTYVFFGQNCLFLIKNMPSEREQDTQYLCDNLVLMTSLIDESIEKLHPKES